MATEFITIEEMADGQRKLKLNFHPGQLRAWESKKRLVCILAGRQGGKALAVDTPIPTPGGFVLIGELKAGDTVFDRSGNTCQVLAVHPVMFNQPCYRVTFDDGSFVVADGDHLWITQTAKQRKNQARRRPQSEWSESRPQCRPTPDESVVTTEVIRQAIRRVGDGDNSFNHSINNCKPVLMPGIGHLPIPPYTLGAWLGDGNSSGAILTSADEEILHRIQADGVPVDKVGYSTRCGKASMYRLGSVVKKKRWDATKRLEAANYYRGGKNIEEISELMQAGKRSVRKAICGAGIEIENNRYRVSHRKRTDKGTFLPGKMDRPRRGDSSLSFQAALRAAGLIGNKHIPDAYLFAPEADRWSLLHGLMDTDGYCAGDGSGKGKNICEFTSINERLAIGVLCLLAGLGIKARVAKNIPTLNGVPKKPCYRVTFTTDKIVFGLERKRNRLPKTVRADVGRRFIVSVEPVPSVPVRCITVDSPDQTYLCTDRFIPTHNTAIGPPWLYREIQARGPGDYLAVSPELSLARKKQIPEIKQYFKSYLNLGTLRESPDISFVFSPDGMRQTFGECGDIPTTIRFGYAAKPESLEAMTVKACWSDEAGQKDYKLDSLYAIDGRLAVNRGRHLISTTPYNLGWLKQKIYDPWQKSGGTHPDIDVIQFDSTQNPAFLAEEFERLRESMPAWKFDLFYRAKFSRPAGLIYDCFDDERHKCPRFKLPDHWQRYMGLDFGGINTAAVFFAEEPNTRRLYAYREYHEGSRIAKNHVLALLKNEPMVPICCGGSKSEGQWRDEFRDAGLPVQEPAVTEVEVGIDRVYAAIASDNVIFFDDLTETLGELAMYSRKTDANGEATDEIDAKSSFHLLDSVRYIIARIRKPIRVLSPESMILPPSGTGNVVSSAPLGVFGRPRF
jgi:hypothetical protein